MQSMLTKIPKPVAKVLGRGILKTQKTSPTVLFVGGVVGVVATAVMASRATLKLDDVLDVMDENIKTARHLRETKPDEVYSDNDFHSDMALIYIKATVDVAKLYGPAILIGAGSIAALTGSHIILTRRNAALTAAYAALDKGFREYRKRVVEELGEDKDRQFRYSTDPVSIVKQEDGTVKKTFGVNDYSVYARFFDELCPAWQRDSEYNFAFLRCQQNYANDLLRSRGHVFLNEVYDLLKMERCRAGAVVGWVLGDGDNFVDFGIFNGDNPRARDFVNGREGSILLDFNVDGVIYDKI